MTPNYESMLRELEEAASKRRANSNCNIYTRLPAIMVKGLDSICETHGVNRSEVMRAALAFYLTQFNEENNK